MEKVRAQVYAHFGSAGKASEANIPKGNVVTCRISDQDLAAIDALVESGVRTTRSEAAAWLIHLPLLFYLNKYPVISFLPVRGDSSRQG